MQSEIFLKVPLAVALASVFSAMTATAMADEAIKLDSATYGNGGSYTSGVQPPLFNNSYYVDSADGKVEIVLTNNTDTAIIGNSTVDLREEGYLTLKSTLESFSLGHGLIQNSTVTGGEKSTLVLKQTGNDSVLSPGGDQTVTINVGTLITESTGPAIYISSTGTLNIQANVIDITSGVVGSPKSSIFVSANGQANISGFSTLTIDAGSGNAICTANGQLTIASEVANSSIELQNDGSRSLVENHPEVSNAVTSIQANTITLSTTSSGTAAIISVPEGSMTVQADNTLTIYGSQTAISATNTGNLTLGAPTLKVTGDINVESTASAPISFKGAQSTFEGTATIAGHTNTLTIADGATWTTKGESTVDSLAVENANINLDSTSSVTVTTLSGSNATVNAAVTTNEEGELTIGSLTANNSDEGVALAVNLKDVTSDDLTAEQALSLMSNISADGAEVTGSVEEGMYNGNITIGSDGTVTVATNSVMRDTLEIASGTALSLNRILMNDVRKRMGDLRSTNGESGAWARWDGGRLSGTGLENDFNTIQVGVDTTPVPGSFRFGVAASYTKGDVDYTRGDADMDAYGLAAYGTWFADNGLFADVIARIATSKTDMTVDGSKKGSLDNTALSLSGELGMRFDCPKGFFAEPQVELTYTYVDADKLTLSNGSSYEFDSTDSLIGRVGGVLGLQCPNNKGNVYVRASVVHEFLGDAAVIGANGTRYETDGKDTWVEFGLGANVNITPNAYVWADVERTEGGTIDEDWRATVGVRYSF